MVRLYEEKLNDAKSHRHGLYYTSLMALVMGAENGQAELLILNIFSLTTHHNCLKKNEKTVYPQ